MTDRRTGFNISKLHYYIGIIVLVISILSSVSSLGYTLRRIDDLDRRVEIIENEGSTSARIVANDILWIRDNIRELKAESKSINKKLDEHMAER